MAEQAVVRHAVSIHLACTAFGISETCYRYQAKLSDDNVLIAEQLIDFPMVASFDYWMWLMITAAKA